MKYQIYLNKSTSEEINGIAKALNQKPSTFIKRFIESCFSVTGATLGEDNMEVVKDYGRAKAK